MKNDVTYKSLLSFSLIGDRAIVMKKTNAKNFNDKPFLCLLLMVLGVVAISDLQRIGQLDPIWKKSDATWRENDISDKATWKKTGVFFLKSDIQWLDKDRQAQSEWRLQERRFIDKDDVWGNGKAK